MTNPQQLKAEYEQLLAAGMPEIDAIHLDDGIIDEEGNDAFMWIYDKCQYDENNPAIYISDKHAAYIIDGAAMEWWQETAGGDTDGNKGCLGANEMGWSVFKMFAYIDEHPCEPPTWTGPTIRAAILAAVRGE